MTQRIITSRVAHVAVSAVLAAACEPQVITVTTSQDGVAGSLRHAIDAANQSAERDVRIELAPGTYRLTVCAASEDDDNRAGDLDVRVDRPIAVAATGPGVVIQQMCSHERVLHSLGGGLLTLSGTTLTGGQTRSSGGGLWAAGDVELRRSTIERNSAMPMGGGVLARGAVHLVESQVLDNQVAGEPRYVGPQWVPGPAFGAGVHASSVTASDSTIARNHLGSCSGTPVTGQSEGGGIYAEQATLTNVTISGHTSLYWCGPEGNNGMAVRSKTLELEHVTITSNPGGAALYVETLRTRHSVVVADGHPVCPNAPTSAEGRYSWFSDASCALAGVGNEQRAAAFALGPLADNGGPVLTQAPSAESVLIDATGTCTQLRDARGVARPQDADGTSEPSRSNEARHTSSAFELVRVPSSQLRYLNCA